MPTLTLYPATGRAVFSGVVHVGQQLTLAVVIAEDETATFASGHAYELTIKRRNYLAAAPYVQEVLTVTGAKTATVALDLRLAAMYSDIGSRDAWATQWSVDDVANGVLGWTASSAAIWIANTAKRSQDVAPPPGGVAITAADLAAALATLEGMTLSDDNPEALAEAADPGESTAAARGDHVHPLPSVETLGAVPASHLSSHPVPTNRDTRNEAQQTAATDGEVTAGTVTAVRKFTPAQLKLAAEAHGGGGGGAELSDATPQDLGTAAGGAGTKASRDDHVHKKPTPAELAAYRAQTPAAAANVSGSVTAAFASYLTLQWTLTGNLTSFAAATGLADGETGMVLITIGAYSLPADPPSGAYKGAWTVTGTKVRLVIERIGSTYLWSADSLEVVS